MSIIFIAVKTWVPQFLNLASLLRHFALKQGSDCYLAGCLLSSSADDPRINKSKLNFQSEKIYLGPFWSSVLNLGMTKMYFLQWFCWTSFVCYVLALLFNSDLAGSDSRTCDDYPMTFPYLIGSNTNRLMFLSLIVSNNINLLVITLVRVIFSKEFLCSKDLVKNLSGISQHQSVLDSYKCHIFTVKNQTDKLKKWQKLMREVCWQRCMLMGDAMGHPRVSAFRLRDINWRPLLLFPTGHHY